MTALLETPILRPISPAQPAALGASSRNERWYVVQTHPSRESEAKRQLENQQFRVFLPRYVKMVRHARKIQKTLAPLFPGYLFLVLDLGRDHWHKVNGTIGVTSLITTGGRPAPVKKGVVETLIESTGTDGEVRFTPSLRLGERVRLVAGPFAEQLGILQHSAASQRVRILMEVLGGRILVDLSRNDVEPVEQNCGVHI